MKNFKEEDLKVVNYGYINEEVFYNFDYAMAFRFLYLCSYGNNDNYITINKFKINKYDFHEILKVSKNMNTKIIKYMIKNELIIEENDFYLLSDKYFSRFKNKKCNVEFNNEVIQELYFNVKNIEHKLIGRICSMFKYCDEANTIHATPDDFANYMGFSNSSNNKRVFNKSDTINFIIKKKRNCVYYINELFIRKNNNHKKSNSYKRTQRDISWKKKVLNRDNNKCVICENDNNLEVHHILSFAKYKELRTDINNGITLCQCHHSSMILNGFHQVYGTRNNTKEQLQEYIDLKRKELNLPSITIDEIINGGTNEKEYNENNI